jgi:hypothetical protein
VAEAVAAANPADRLARLEDMVAGLAEEVRHPPMPDDPRLDVLVAAIADAFEHFGKRLASIEDAAGRVALDARVLAEQVGPVPSHLSAIASQVDRITPLVRVGDDADSLFEQLDRIGCTLDAVASLLGSRAGTSEMEQLDAVIDVLSGLVRRQEEMAFAIALVLDQVRGPSGSDPILERLARLERSNAVDLDDAAVRVQGYPVPADGAEIKKMLLSVAERVDTLSHIVAGMTKDSSAELSALQQRIVRSLAIFDTVRLQVKEFAEKPPLTQDDVHWIADAVTQSLLETVRVETGPLRP